VVVIEPLVTKPTIRRLEWDCHHFGLAIAQIVGNDWDDPALSDALTEARNEGYQLVYWATSTDRPISKALMVEFQGTQVDQKATFVRQTVPDVDCCFIPPPPNLTIGAYTGAEASDDLVQLAIAAGVYSRFGVDNRIPPDKFEELYRVWIERSVRHEIADDVLVISNGAGADKLAGMVTVKVTEKVGNIGLIAVSEDYRGQGIGSLLIQAAHYWMYQRGAREMNVITQRANRPACRLYERTGYLLAGVQYYYHFWL
jgi:dTDP-4-amino-4,6-dideoxy-D-galactose acyltransferase